MAEYEIEWTEHRKMRARIQAPPNDERILEAAQTTVIDRFRRKPEVVAWAERDDKSLPVEDSSGFQAVTYDVTLVGRVVKVEHKSPMGPGFEMISEEVQPL